MKDALLFLGPGTHLIQPYIVSQLPLTYGRHTIPWGWWYRRSPIELIRPATTLEIYIWSKYEYCKPRNE